MPALEEWVAAEARFAATAVLRAISATDLVTMRPGFGQRVIPHPGSVLASPVPAHYDPDPDYFFHWFRDSAIVIDALRVALAAGDANRSAALLRFREFVQFSLQLRSIDGQAFLDHSNFKAQVLAPFLEYVRPDADIAALVGEAVLGDVRVNADGTLDFFRWSRPQNDGPALHVLTLLRWWHQFPNLLEEPALAAAVREVLSAALAFTLSHAIEPSGDVWEEQNGFHYFTLLLQSEALRRGAEWLEGMGQHEHVRACRAAADETLARLDDFWNDSGRYYRSGDAGGSGPRREFDISVVLAVLHAARANGPHSVLDPRVQATLTALEELFEAEFAINRERPPDRGPALGRYAGDRYYGGGAWYLATLAAAEFYFRLAQALRSGAEMPITPENLPFRERLGATGSVAGGERLARLAIERGDSFLRTVRAFTPDSGELSEQFDRNTGAQASAKHLSWSYAAFITAAASRAAACRSIRAADPAATPAGTAG